MLECCGNCERYTYEGKDRKGHCDYYGSYYYPTDSCSHFKEGEENVREGSSGSCFLPQPAVLSKACRITVRSWKRCGRFGMAI